VYRDPTYRKVDGMAKGYTVVSGRGGPMAGPYTRRVDAERVLAEVLAEQSDYVAGLRPGDLAVREVYLDDGDRVFERTLGRWVALEPKRAYE
jgi:hypothetical protein